MNKEIGLEEIKLALVAIWKNKILIIVVTVLAFLMGILLTLGVKTETIYQASATVYSVTYGKSSSGSDGSSSNVSTIVNYKDALNSQLVCEYALNSLLDYNLDVKMLQSMVHMTVQSNSYMMDIYADTWDSDLSIDVANAMADAFVYEVNRITGKSDVQVLERAAESNGQVVGSPKKIRIMIPLAVFVCMCGYIAIREFFTDRLRVVNQCLCAMDDDVKVLGLVPFMENEK